MPEYEPASRVSFVARSFDKKNAAATESPASHIVINAKKAQARDHTPYSEIPKKANHKRNREYGYRAPDNLPSDVIKSITKR